MPPYRRDKGTARLPSAIAVELSAIQNPLQLSQSLNACAKVKGFQRFRQGLIGYGPHAKCCAHRRTCIQHDTLAAAHRNSWTMRTTSSSVNAAAAAA